MKYPEVIKNRPIPAKIDIAKSKQSFANFLRSLNIGDCFESVKGNGYYRSTAERLGITLTERKLANGKTCYWRTK